MKRVIEIFLEDPEGYPLALAILDRYESLTKPVMAWGLISRPYGVRPLNLEQKGTVFGFVFVAREIFFRHNLKFRINDADRRFFVFQQVIRHYPYRIISLIERLLSYYRIHGIRTHHIRYLS